jgi:hypothetical protein
MYTKDDIQVNIGAAVHFRSVFVFLSVQGNVILKIRNFPKNWWLLGSAVVHYLEMSGQLHASAALCQGKSPLYTFQKRVGGPCSRSGRRGENALALTGNQTPVSFIIAITLS